jgi:hypothetical protein
MQERFQLRLPHVERHETKDSSRRPLSEKVKRQVVAHFPYLAEDDLSTYLYEMTPSTHFGAVEDVVVYDMTGKPAFRGRTFRDGLMAFWSN